MSDDLTRRLLLAETDFLDALQSGLDTLTSYRQILATLPGVSFTAMQTGSVGTETLSLAHTIASRISLIAGRFLDIKHRENSTTVRLQRDCDVMLHQMAALDLNASSKSFQSDNRNDTHCFRPYPNMPIPGAECSTPPFLAARRWLLDNLHNPYPSAEVKAQFAAASSCQVSSINSWFINARRRIGWTTLCREHFSNCRADTIDAAYRALVEEDSQRILSPELRHFFVTMKVTAEGLYSSTFDTFTRGPDTVVRDVTKDGRESVGVERCSQINKADVAQAVPDSYPSPDPSTTASPVPALDPSLTDDSEEEEEVAPPNIAGSKRRRSMEPADQSSSITSRPIKRLCTSTTSRTYLPSPSTDGIDEPSYHNSLVPLLLCSTLPEISEVLPSRKRRLSEAGVTEAPRRSCGPTAAPLPTVSDPLPHLDTGNEYSIDDWFSANFDDLFALPPPVDASKPDYSTSWEVELFKGYSIPGNPKHTSKCPLTAAADTCISSLSNLSDLEVLLQSVGGDTSSNGVLLSSVTEPVYTASHHSSIPDMSQTDIDWMSLIDGKEDHQLIGYSMFPQYLTDPQPLPEVDLSMLQLPEVMPVVHSQGDFPSKQAKLHQLRAMQQVVRKMEQELRSEGVTI